jgi:hypothetical protein
VEVSVKAGVDTAAAPALAILLGIQPAAIERIGEFVHQTTHRTVNVRVFTAPPAKTVTAAAKMEAAASLAGGTPCVWKHQDDFGNLGMSNAAKRAVEMARVARGEQTK